MKKTIRNTIGIFVILIGLLTLREWILRPNGAMHVVFLDTGQGDSTLLTFRNGTRMLIDGGPDWSPLESLGKRLPFFDRRIDILVLSHPNSDHMTSFGEIIRRYDVQTLITAGTPFSSDMYHAILSGALLRSVALTTVEAGDTLHIADATLSILWPPSPRPTGMSRDANNDSIYLMLEESGKRILFTGDGESIVEKTLVAAGTDLKADILKIAHHGSKTSSGTGFLLAVNPKTAMISVGKNNPYGHPSPSIIKLLERLSINIRRTDQEGDIEVVW